MVVANQKNSESQPVERANRGENHGRGSLGPPPQCAPQVTRGAIHGLGTLF